MPIRLIEEIRKNYKINNNLRVIEEILKAHYFKEIENCKKKINAYLSDIDHELFENGEFISLEKIKEKLECDVDYYKKNVFSDCNKIYLDLPEESLQIFIFNIFKELISSLEENISNIINKLKLIIYMAIFYHRKKIFKDLELNPYPAIYILYENIDYNYDKNELLVLLQFFDIDNYFVENKLFQKKK